MVCWIQYRVALNNKLCWLVERIIATCGNKLTAGILNKNKRKFEIGTLQAVILSSIQYRGITMVIYVIKISNNIQGCEKNIFFNEICTYFDKSWAFFGSMTEKRAWANPWDDFTVNLFRYGLAPNRRQAITWNNDGTVCWRIYTSLSLIYFRNICLLLVIYQ